MLRNVLRGPFLTFNAAIQLSIYQSYVYRLSKPFLYNSIGQIKISYSSFKQGLDPVFVIGENGLFSNQCSLHYANEEFLSYKNISESCYVFFGCCLFDNVSQAIFSNSKVPYTVKIRKCSFYIDLQDSELISLSYNEQLIIENSFFLLFSNDTKKKLCKKGLFILSDSTTSSSRLLSSRLPSYNFLSNAKNENLHSYFSLQRSFFGFYSSEVLNSEEETRDTIASTALFHDINYNNMTNIKINNCDWGCCLGINTEAMIKITFCNFNNNTCHESNLIWIWNLPDKQHQRFSYNCFYNNDVGSLLFVDKNIYIENCNFSNTNFFDTDYFGRFGDVTYITSNVIKTNSLESLIFDISQINNISNCNYNDPTSTPTPQCTKTPSLPRTPLPSIYIILPTITPFPTETPLRTPWPPTTPMPSSTPTATPPYVPIAGITAAVVFALCLIIFLIVFFCREYYHKSSEDTVDDNNPNVNLSGLDEKSYSSETDPLNLNPSSDDSFVL